MLHDTYTNLRKNNYLCLLGYVHIYVLNKYFMESLKLFKVYKVLFKFFPFQPPQRSFREQTLQTS